MRKSFRLTLILAGTLICVLPVVNAVMEMHWRRTLASQGEGQFLDTTAENLERQVRDSIPRGCERAAAEAALGKIGLRSSYDVHSRTLFSGARVLKGSNWLVQSGVSIQLHFDSNGRLSAIESRAENTGP
jgi:hypothetical protein